MLTHGERYYIAKELIEGKIRRETLYIYLRLHRLSIIDFVEIISLEKIVRDKMQG